MAVIDELRAADPASFAWKPPPYEYEHDKQPIDVIAGSPSFRAAIDAGERAEQIVAALATASVAAFRALQQRFFLYELTACLPPGLVIERTVTIEATAERVLAAFFDPHDLASVVAASARSVTVPRPLGPYAVEWADQDYRRRAAGPARRDLSRHGDGLSCRRRVLRRRRVLEPAGRRADRPDGAGSALRRGRGPARHEAHGPAERRGRRAALAALLRRRRQRAGSGRSPT